MTTEQRKIDHLEICLNQNVETGSTLLEDVTLVHNTLPEIDYDEIDTGIDFLGKRLNLPLIISSMTGGTKEAENINKELARVAEKKKIGFALGSQRPMLEKAELRRTYNVRGVAPKTLIFGNIGLAQLKKYNADRIRNALKVVKADAIFVHINPAQEAFQNEGDLDFFGGLEAIKKLSLELGYPVLAKEVGFGVSKENAIALKNAAVKAIDVAGAGGTNWVLIESIRSGKEAELFKNAGIPTALSIFESKPAGIPMIASGGIRSGLDMAKSIALGASCCGIALPFLRILNKEGDKGVSRYIDRLAQEFRTAMFLSGCRDVAELRKAKYVLGPKIKAWVDQRKLL